MKIILDGIIHPWEVSNRDVKNQLKGAKKNERLDVELNSPGGSIHEGIAIFNTLAAYEGPVDITITGLAASMGSVIALAGDRTMMVDNGTFMIHNPWTIDIGEADQFRRTANELDRLKGIILNLYSRKTGKSEDELSQMMDDETHMCADDAEEFGFVDEVLSTDRKERAQMLMNFKSIDQFSAVFESNKLVALKQKEESTMDKDPTLESATDENEERTTEETEEQETAAEETEENADVSNQADTDNEGTDGADAGDEEENEDANAEEEGDEDEGVEVNVSVKDIKEFTNRIAQLKAQLEIQKEINDEALSQRDEEIGQLRAERDDLTEKLQAHKPAKKFTKDSSTENRKVGGKVNWASMTPHERTNYFRENKDELLGN